MWALWRLSWKNNMNWKFDSLPIIRKFLFYQKKKKFFQIYVKEYGKILWKITHLSESCLSQKANKMLTTKAKSLCVVSIIYFSHLCAESIFYIYINALFSWNIFVVCKKKNRRKKKKRNETQSLFNIISVYWYSTPI